MTPWPAPGTVPSVKSALPSPLFAVGSPDWSVIEPATEFLPNTSPISWIGADALAPVLTVTIILIGELAALAASVEPAGKAMRTRFDNGAGGVVVQVAESGEVPSGDVV